MKYRLLTLIPASVFAIVAVAHAQEPPAPSDNDAPSAPPADTTPPPTDTSTPALPSAPVAPPPTPPGPDTTSPAPAKKEEKKPNPFRFSWFTWNQTATTTIFGVGRDNIGSEDEEYDW